MKRKLILSILLSLITWSISIIFLSMSSIAQEDKWIKRQPLRITPEVVYRSTAFTINGKGYVGAGVKGLPRVVTFDFFEYDPIGDVWSQKADAPANPDATGFTVGSKGYITAGHSNLLMEYDPVSNQWTRKADFPGSNRANAVGFSIAGKGYISTGIEDGNSALNNDLWEYDPLLDKWTKKADVPGPKRYLAAGFSIGNKGYVGTGLSYGETGSNFLGDFYEYDPSLDTWAKKADIPAGPISFPSLSTIAVSIGHVGYIQLKYFLNGESITKLLQYDPLLNTWTNITSSPNALFAFAIGDEVYFGNDDGTYVGLFEYNPVTNSWTKRANSISWERGSAVAFSIGNYGYLGTGVVFGRLFPQTLKDFWRYDALNNSWTQIADLPGPARNNAVAFAIANKGYVGTGYELQSLNPSASLIPEKLLKDFWEYDPTTNSWTRKADFGGSARSDAVGFSISNKGYIGTGGSKDFWEYNPITDLWTKKADYSGVAISDAVGFSIGDKGYVGLGRHGAYARDFWQYNPSLGQWSAKADFPNGRIDAVGFAIGNKGYIGTGASLGSFNSTTYYQDFWQYNLESNSWTAKSPFAGVPRSRAVAITIGGKGYLGTGIANLGPYADWWQYEPEVSQTEPLTARARVKEYYNPTSIVLDGSSSSDPMNSPLTFSWKKTAGPEMYTILFPDHAFPNVINLVTGTYTFTLTVKNVSGSASSADISFTINSNLPPIAKASIKEYYSPTSVVLDGSRSSDPEGKPLRYAWTKLSGPDTYNILFPDHSFPNVVNLGNGFYTFRLTVTDDQGVSSTSDVSFTIKQNNPPIAKAWLAEYKSSNSVLLSGWASYDPDGGAVTYAWSKVSGPSFYTISGDDTYNATLSNLLTGTYTCRLTVTDMDGAMASADVTFDIKSTSAPANAPPIAKAWLALYNSSTSVLLSGWASYDPEGKPVSYLWSYVSGPASYLITDGTFYNATISNLVAGTYTFRLTVKDDLGATASEDVTFTMNATAKISSGRNDIIAHDHKFNHQINIYPNPVTDLLQYKWSSEYKGLARLTVMDLSGKAIIMADIKKQTPEHFGELNVTALKPGAYYLYIKIPNGKFMSNKFIKK